MKHLYFHDFLEFWEDDEEIRMEDERAWFLSQFRKVVDLARCHPVHLRSMVVRWEGSSTKMELDAPRPNENRAIFLAGENATWFLITSRRTHSLNHGNGDTYRSKR